MYSSYFIIIPPWKRAGPIVWTNLSPLHLKMLCAKLDEIGPVVLEKKIFFYFVNVFLLFRIISSWKRAGLFIWTNLDPLYPGMQCVKFGSNWPSGSGEEDENVKNLRNNNDTNTNDDNDDDDKQRTNFDQKSSLEPFLQITTERIVKIDWTNSNPKKKVLSKDFFFGSWREQVV